MAEEPDNLVLRYLRAIDSKVDDVREILREHTTRLGHLEQGLAQVHVTMAELSLRVDRVAERVDRIETRLNLRETVTG